MKSPPAAAHSVAVVGNLVRGVPEKEFIIIQVCCMASSHVGVPPLGLRNFISAAGLASPVYFAAVLHTSEAIMGEYESGSLNENEYENS